MSDGSITVAKRKVAEAARAVELVERELGQRLVSLQRDLEEARAMRSEVDGMATSLRRLEAVAEQAHGAMA